jgi:hypothetical protein
MANFRDLVYYPTQAYTGQWITSTCLLVAGKEYCQSSYNEGTRTRTHLCFERTLPRTRTHLCFERTLRTHLCSRLDRTNAPRQSTQLNALKSRKRNEGTGWQTIWISQGTEEVVRKQLRRKEMRLWEVHQARKTIAKKTIAKMRPWEVHQAQKTIALADGTHKQQSAWTWSDMWRHGAAPWSKGIKRHGAPWCRSTAINGNGMERHQTAWSGVACCPPLKGNNQPRGAKATSTTINQTLHGAACGHGAPWSAATEASAVSKFVASFAHGFRFSSCGI